VLATITGRRGLHWSGFIVMVILVLVFAWSLNLTMNILDPYLSTASNVAIVTITIILTIVAVPLTHWLSGNRHSRLFKGYALWQPFVGGFRLSITLTHPFILLTHMR
jgi:hypothetical protein